MRIFYTHEIFSSQVYGGISRYFNEMISAARRHFQDHELEIFAGFYVNKTLTGDRIGFRVPKLPYTRSLIHHLNYCWQNRLIKSSPPDLVHVTYPFRFPEKKYAPIAFTIHDMLPELYPRQFRNSERVISLKRAFCEVSDLLIAVSESTRTDLLRFYPGVEDKVQVIPHGVNLSPRPRIVSTAERPFILYVGTHEPYKNFERLCEALLSSELLCDFDLVSFGTQDPRVESLSESIVRELGARLIVLGGSDDVLGELYSRSTALVYPSLYEGFGMPVLEAMAAGCPVICSNTSSLPEVGGGAAAYFDPASVDSIRLTLEKFLLSDSNLKELAGAGRQRALQFSWQRTAEATMGAYSLNFPRRCTIR